MFQKHVIPGLMVSLLKLVVVGVIFFLILNIGKIQPLLVK